MDVPDPDDLTVDETKAAIRERDLSAEALEELRDAEADGKNRVTLTRWLDERIDEAPAENAVARERRAERAEPTENRQEGTGRDGEADTGRHDGWPGPPEELPDYGETVVVQNTERGHIAGYYFENVYDVRRVPFNGRIERALEEGSLERIRDRRR